MTGDSAIPAWVVEAAAMPVAFAQVREDPAIDLAVIDGIGRGGLNGIMIASGGCTAAALFASGRFARLHLVDVNPAQIAITRLKLHLLQTATPMKRLRLLGHAPMALGRAEMLTAILQSLDLAPNALGEVEFVARVGPDCAGRYEMLFARLREELRDGTRAESAQRNAPRKRRRLNDEEEEMSFTGETALGSAFDEAFDRTMALPNLVRLFGAQATQNSVRPFSRHFAERTRLAMKRPTENNPWLWQMLMGRFPPGLGYPWLTAPSPARTPVVTESIGTMDAALREFKGEFDFVHLSNILDWLSADEARRTLALAGAALRPGGVVLIRQLNSTLDVPSMGGGFDWSMDEARDLLARDRSFFYAALHLGRKQ